jgi:hypothetical protein
MSEFSAFFAQNADTDVVEEVIVSERFKNKDGKSIPWKIRALTESENEQLRKACTKRTKQRGGAITNETDSTEYAAKLMVTSIVYPNLKDAELQNSYGVMGAEELLRKMLLAGEYSNLFLKVQELTGFDQDLNELVEEAKN